MPDSTEADPLGYSFFVLHIFVEHWFALEPDFQAFLVEMMKDYRFGLSEPLEIPSDAQQALDVQFKRRDSIRQRIQEHSTAVLVFGDQQGIDMTPMLRFIRAAEQRCSFREVDEQLTLDCLERAHLRYLAMRPNPTEVPANFNATQKKAFAVILSDGPILGKHLARRVGVKWATLKRHVLPPLRTVGVKNDRNCGGYYIDR